MGKFLFYTLPLLVLLQACFVTSDHAPIANPHDVTSSLALKSHPEYANVYIRRDADMTHRMSPLGIKINNQLLGKLKDESYFNVKMVPGTYTLGTEGGVSFSYTFKPGQIVLIQCSLGILDTYYMTDEMKEKILVSIPLGNDYLSPCWHETKPSTIANILKKDTLLKAHRTLYAPAGYAEYKQARQKNSINSYQSYIAAFPETTYTKNAQINLDQLKERKEKENWEILRKQQKCTLQNRDWLYIDKNCKKRKADGKGRAVYIDTRHSFEGTIINGRFVSGKYLLDGQMVYDGQFVNDQPSGKGICLYEGAMEECKYYNGERVDSLYKQRLAMHEMEKRQQQALDEIRDEISSLKNRGSQREHSGKGNGISDALVDKAIDKGMNKLFDFLF